MTDEEFIGKHIEVEKSLCDAVKKAKINAKSEALKALEDVRAEVEAMYGVTDTCTRRLMIDKYEVLESIERKIKEIEHE